MIYSSIFSGAFLGWALGANDAANIFGTAVHTKVIKYSTAIILISIFVIIGAYVDGYRGIENLSNYAYSGGVTTSLAAFLVMLSAGLTILLMTILKIPVSSSQAVIGAIMGAGVLINKTDFSKSLSFFSAWVITPVGALIIGYILYKIFVLFFESTVNNIFLYDKVIKGGYVISGIFSAYSLGANNVANVTAVFAGNLNLISTKYAVIIGGVSIALGVITFSKNVMETVGNDIVQLTPISGFLSVMASAITVYIYALIGIPVSTSQAIVGALIGIGLVKGVNAVNFSTIKNIVVAWIATPIFAGTISFMFSFLYN